ncbi:MAG: acetate--CoA ligase family protein [Candidatus Aminicenantes bacterium]|nr:acetate--CoA ligase family protein [Candidatus Aminicenantes bacterium]
MARLYEYQGKKILKLSGIKIPEGDVANTPKQAKEITERLGPPVVLKIQVWSKGRAEIGGVKFANSPEEAEQIASALLGIKVKNFIVEKLLVEKKADIDRELFAGIIIDDYHKKPMLVFSSIGGTGIEEIAREHPEAILTQHIDVLEGFPEYRARKLLTKMGFKGKILVKLSSTLSKLYKAFREYDARSAEINPLVITVDGEVVALDCHITIDDYAVYRHSDLGIEIAREFDRPPTELEKIAYKVEEKDYRGTFYFFQMTEKPDPAENYIGFHGAGGGGSMMSMDAVLKRGFKIANFTDTSGNPPASKVYRAAKIILSQPGIVGYFASGSGVASQEQFNSARGLVKAFMEDQIEIPAVLRLGGNYEEKAIEILETFSKFIPAKIEGYGRDDSPEFCADRLAELIKEGGRKVHRVKPIEEYKPPKGVYSFNTLTGKVFIDHSACAKCERKVCVDACSYGVLKFENGRPVLAIAEEDAGKGKCTECLACELACFLEGKKAIHIELPIPGLKEYREKILKEGE